ncbi:MULTISPECIES: hypothetical protein [Prevotellaceae]|uniref:hypothetical protein n=1 Tax=Prevotellaceae TaxID=171552 RepID=UPI0003F6B18A|nr:hypothetical protein [Prevotella phocaeensis]
MIYQRVGGNSPTPFSTHPKRARHPLAPPTPAIPNYLSYHMPRLSYLYPTSMFRRDTAYRD